MRRKLPAVSPVEGARGGVELPAVSPEEEDRRIPPTTTSGAMKKIVRHGNEFRKRPGHHGPFVSTRIGAGARENPRVAQLHDDVFDEGTIGMGVVRRQ